MKKLILISALCILSLNAFAQGSLSCSDIYQKSMISKEIKKNKINGHAGSLGAAGFIISLGSPAIGLALLVPGIGLGIYSDIPSKEARVLRILKEGDRHLIKFTKRLNKEISSEITAEEVLDVLKGGLDSGLYCQNFPDLYSPGEVREHVEEVLKSKYAGK